MAASVALAVAAFASGTGLAGGLAAAAALGLAGGYLVLTQISGMPAAPMAVAVGQEAPDFTAPDSNGEPLTLSSLRGRPVLLKFFRGHW
jgi:cytochrome oxidase Cu insertion factor (SCO1/SenC/PrrC family)